MLSRRQFLQWLAALAVPLPWSLDVTNPFYGLTPVTVPFSGTVDANGNFKLTRGLRVAFWTHTKMAGTCSAGSPIWTVQSGAGPLGFGKGPRAEIAPILLAPGDQLTITLIGATPGAAVQGQFVGAQAATADLAMSYNPAASSIAVEASAGQVLLGTITTLGDGLPNSQTFPLPVPEATQAIAVVCRTTGGFFIPASAIVNGDVTSQQYVSFLAANQDAASDVERWFLPDRKAVCTVTDQGVGKPASVNFIAMNYGPVTTVRTGNTGPAIRVKNDIAFAALVVQEGANPPIWQAANLRPILVSFNLIGGAANRLQLLAGVGGQTIRMFSATIGLDAALGAGQAFRLTDGDPNAGGTTFAEFESISSANPAPHAYYGAPLTAGNGLFIFSDANATVRGVVTVSQG